MGIVAVLLCAVASATALAQEREPRVVGGDTTTIERWPWQVAIAQPPSSGGDGFDRQFCGGSLVARTIVITAAHCVYDFGDPTGLTCVEPIAGYNDLTSDASNFSVITGRTRLSSSQGAEIPVAEVYYFVRGPGGAPQTEAQSSPGQGEELFDCNTFEWDVVFLELASAAPAPANPILIAGAGERDTWAAGRPAVVTGWGATSEGGSGSDTLRFADLAIISDASCGSESAYGSDFFAETMVCAGIFPKGGSDTCQGDSGGPLVVPISSGAYRLVGDTSFGDGCARPNKPGVYGRLADNPIRSALRAGILGVAGVDVAGSNAAAPAARAPKTRITKAPKRRTKKPRARFAFTADEPAAFECRFDRKPFKSCESPLKRRMRPGRHRFRVRAIDSEGNVDKTPAKHRWKVKRRRTP